MDIHEQVEWMLKGAKDVQEGTPLQRAPSNEPPPVPDDELPEAWQAYYEGHTAAVNDRAAATIRCVKQRVAANARQPLRPCAHCGEPVLLVRTQVESAPLQERDVGLLAERAAGFAYESPTTVSTEYTVRCGCPSCPYTLRAGRIAGPKGR